MINGENVLVFDNAGIPSVMTKFTRTKNSDLFGGSDRFHSMFKINDEIIDEIYLSKYKNTIINGKAYSLPYHKPATNLTEEEIAEACFSKGDGWHPFTVPEWGFLALDSLRKGTLPHGNTNFGSDYRHPEEKGVLYDGYRTLTGSGPATWSHDHTPYGVYDLCGNIWERVVGLRLINGEVQIISNNDAANRIDTSRNSPLWKPILVKGKSIKFSVDGRLILTTGESKQGWTGCRWKDLEVDFDIPEELKELALFAGEPNAGIWADTEDEMSLFRGGHSNSTSYAGVFYSILYNPRSGVDTNIGFRSAYYRKTA